MFLLFVRSSPLLLLLLLPISPVTTATEEAATPPTCPQEVPVKLVRDLWRQTRELINNLPKGEKTSRRVRLLPKFCTKCAEPSGSEPHTHVIGWLELREVMDVYQRRVFSCDVIKKLLPPDYTQLLHRLQDTLEHCVSSSKPSKWFKTIKRLERKIKKRRGDGAVKAVEEFTFILGWIDELSEHHII